MRDLTPEERGAIDKHLDQARSVLVDRSDTLLGLTYAILTAEECIKDARDVMRYMVGCAHDDASS